MGVKVEALPDFMGGLEPGWILALWAEHGVQKIYLHWRDQLKREPWGKEHI